MKYTKTVLTSIILVLLIPAACATPSTLASGSLVEEAIEIKDIGFADGNMIISSIATLNLSGNFNGKFVEEERTVIKSSGEGTLKALGTFTGTVDGVPGSLLMSVVCTVYGGGISADGRFVILSGTDGLSNLHGEGTFSIDQGTGSYSAQVHFEPEL